MAKHAAAIPELDDYNRYRFWAKVDRRGGLFACWPWTAAASKEGYGRFKLNGKLWSAHRIAASLREGGIPESDSYHGFVVMHSCDNPACCNPAHLLISTQAENVRDMDKKGRRPTCAKHKHSAEIIDLIRTAPGSSREVGRQFGLSDGYVRQVRRREVRR